MESTSISDVRRMCQRGAFRAYVQGGKVFLEDTDTGQVVPLNGESGPANTERRVVPHREDRRGSRVERMFGARDTWKSADPDADQGPYRGFLIVQCEECGEVYDEIYISVYENTMINGKPYSLPLQEPVTNITMEDFAQACFYKGEGWHCLTAAEWGLLADTSLKLGTLPHGNTNCSHWHGDDKEQGIIIEDSYKTLTGSGPATWTHDHTASGVHDLCGNIWEFARGVRIRDGALWAAENNDAALPETDLTECGDGWKPITDAEGHPLYVAVEDNKITFNTYPSIHRDYCGCAWGNVRMNCDSEQLRALALFAGEEKAGCYVDSTEGEYILIRGGNWYRGGYAGVFGSDLGDPRSNAGGNLGGRSAYFKKH